VLVDLFSRCCTLLRRIIQLDALQAFWNGIIGIPLSALGQDVFSYVASRDGCSLVFRLSLLEFESSSKVSFGFGEFFQTVEAIGVEVA
jgi:hypothetical protein